MQRPHDNNHDDDVDEAPALAALQLLVQEVPPERRKEAARRIYEILREEYGRAARESPGWIESLKKLVDTEFR